MTAAQTAELIRNLKLVFDIVRLVDVSMTLQYTFGEDGKLIEGAYKCYAVWNKNGRCENCISAKALTTKGRMTKYEFIDDDIYYVVAKYVEVDGVPYILEIVSDVTDGILFGALGKSTIVRRIQNYNNKLYRDSLTGAYNRRYYDEQLWGLRNAEAIAIIDIDNFKQINDTHGHGAGDRVLQELSRSLNENVRSSDSVIRYGGDEFLLVFRDMSEGGFATKLEELRSVVQKIKLPEYPEIKLSVSIGGCYSAKKGGDAMALADKMLYKSKLTKNSVSLTSIN